MTFKSLGNQPGSVTFAESTDIRSTFRAKVDSAPKNISGVSVTNNRAEFIRVKPAEVTVGTLVGVESLSLRMTFSGSIENNAALVAEWGNFKQYVDQCITSGSLKGFVPYDVVLTAV